MAVCYFNNDDEKKLNCRYEKNEDGIEVWINYEIENEIEPDLNGAILFGTDTKFEKRDILIIDSDAKMNYLLKDAIFYGKKKRGGLQMKRI